MEIFIFLLVSYVLLSISLFFLFPKAGEAGWKGLVPGLNFVVWCKIIGRPLWHAALLIVPIINIFVYAGMCVQMVRSFWKIPLCR
jgi:signal peptidase I